MLFRSSLWLPSFLYVASLTSFISLPPFLYHPHPSLLSFPFFIYLFISLTPFLSSPPSFSRPVCQLPSFTLHIPPYLLPSLSPSVSSIPPYLLPSQSLSPSSIHPYLPLSPIPLPSLNPSVHRSTPLPLPSFPPSLSTNPLFLTSEERRVGKACRSRWSP